MGKVSFQNAVDLGIPIPILLAQTALCAHPGDVREVVDEEHGATAPVLELASQAAQQVQRRCPQPVQIMLQLVVLWQD